MNFFFYFCVNNGMNPLNPPLQYFLLFKIHPVYMKAHASLVLFSDVLP